jgi:hypothetical protein
MKEFSGNEASRPNCEVTQRALEPATPALPEGRKDYRKPSLRRLGLLRSVTGSDLKW